jgi:tRNA(fMet)-specific endonuclease VapC
LTGLLLDTDILIYLRDDHREIRSRMLALSGPYHLSAISHVELINGLYRSEEALVIRRQRLIALLQAMHVLPFDEFCVEQFEAIIAQAGYSRRKTADRMIAATAIAHGLTLVTRNGDDFADIPNLNILAW